MHRVRKLMKLGSYRYVQITNDGDSNKIPEQWWKCSSVAVKFWLIFFMLGGYLFYQDYFEIRALAMRHLVRLSEEPQLPDELSSLNGYLINTPGCRIPDMQPFDPSVKKYIYPPEEESCNEDVPPLFESNFSAVYMKTELMPLYKNMTNSQTITCFYDEFTRIEPENKKPDTEVIFTGNWKEIRNEEFFPTGEFVKVKCQNDLNKVIYEDYFAFVPAKRIETDDDPVKNKPNILIIGLDAISRVNLHRQLPLTTRLLKAMGAIELLGYNKVADNTFPNLIPVFTGLFEKELVDSCYPNQQTHFDTCPFIWHNYSKQSYVTGLGEDCAWIGLFNYQKVGFRKQTSDYYYTTFSRQAELNIGSNKDFNCEQCVGGRRSYKLIVEYIKKFTMRMNLSKTPYFGFFWGNSLSHDYLNRPSMGDPDYHQLFKELNETGSLNNTVLIFMSDHGIRWGDIRKTYQGQMEERLPFVIMKFPEWFKQTYPAAVGNFIKNTRRLTTPFDLHETLKQLLDVDQLLNVRKIMNEKSRGYSLFDEIPKQRTCEDAEIVSHWCTCQQSVAIETDNKIVVSAAKFAVDHINSQLKGYGDCAILDLANITQARVLTYDAEHITSKESVKDYTITLNTTPGDAIFEVTVRQKEGTGNVAPGNFSVTGSISRLNLYGKQSYCITDFHLKLYCYCKSLLKS
ncbi:uncharacterized protein LOC126743706 isoform X2 [Anthonomus grandis grandis]|uniref:uncharacterized protein LOC126743706 isoform X1 n=1 Tax=Anthonomus grandis grandis TaxID=2921223 RepID=UPI0021658611|nr:uncharacterized protein LOC126743706 isoform X1 [Anthonomus grandis grandis]XP_050306877.1 uncharacterized protein LOC126743706 isoform X2 [Anthonomus grandis grandis]